MDGRRKIQILEAQIQEANGGRPSDFSAWKQRTAAALRTALGPNHPSVAEFADNRYSLSVFSSSTPASAFTEARENGVRRAIAILEGAIYELGLTVEEADADSSETVAPVEGGTVFVVHGHDGGRQNEVSHVVQRLTGQTPVVLHEQPDAGRTIIEKFEDHADGAAFAIVILTGDDVGRALTEQSEQPRARQNVVFEAGFFIGRLGRSRVVLLYEAGVELPSDLTGVLYRELDDGGRWHYELGKELRHAGIDADLNRL